jgi:ankyrin repeat protein
MLQAAPYRSDDAVVKFLLEQGAEVNAMGGWYGNALQAASYRRHGGVTKMPLAWGAQPLQNEYMYGWLNEAPRYHT